MPTITPTTRRARRRRALAATSLARETVASVYRCLAPRPIR
jgi:hypothetical protein